MWVPFIESVCGGFLRLVYGFEATDANVDKLLLPSLSF